MSGPLTCSASSFEVLVFSKTAGFRHDSIPAGVEAIQQLGLAHDFGVVATEDAAQINKANLTRFKAVIFLHTTGNFLDPAQKSSLRNYISSGGGFVGIHGAADAEYDWPWWGELVGGQFKTHPAIQQATVLVMDADHPSTSVLPVRWVRTDEWYNFRVNPRSEVRVLATLDEATYAGGEMGPDHPIAWYREFDGGRAWYTALGHTIESFAEPEFRAHLLGGIEWAAGRTRSDTEA